MGYFNDDPIIKSKHDIVMERYVGKSPELVKIERELDKLVKMIEKGHYSFMGQHVGDMTAKELNDSAINRKVESMFKSFFGLKGFNLVWIYTPNANAYTLPKSMQVLDKHYKVNKKTGVDTNKNMDLWVFVNTGLVSSAKMNTAEVMSVILHEVGHNFYKSFLQIINTSADNIIYALTAGQISTTVVGNAIGVVLGDMLVVPFMQKFLKLRERVVDDFIDNMGLRKIFTALYESLGFLKRLTPSSIKTLVYLLKNPLAINPISNLSSYTMERHADTFAIDYGYGPANITAQNKLDRRENDIVYDVPIFNWIMDFDQLMYDVFISNFSGYPNGLTRQYSTLKRLKAAQNDPKLPPRLKKELDVQVKECEEILDNLNSIQNDENKKRIFTWSYRKVIIDIFDGVMEPREIFFMMTKEYDTKDTWSSKH